MLGFTLDTRGQALNFDNVKKLVQEEDIDPRAEPRALFADNPHQILRNQTQKTLHSVLRRKRYTMVQDKRVLDETTGLTYPQRLCTHSRDVGRHDVGRPVRRRKKSKEEKKERGALRASRSGKTFPLLS